jgi:TIR domain
MRAIFISYRREDAEGQAGRLFDDLARHFGEDTVFMDVAGIEPGRDFRRVIDEHVASCDVLLAMIGKTWIDAADESGRRRLEDPMDFVRLETASALKRDIPVVPVLVHGAHMPRADQLPADLAELAYRNGVELTHARWDSDVQVLIKALSPYVQSLPKNAGRADTAAPAGRGAVGTSLPITPLTTTRPAAKMAVVVAGSVAALMITVGGYAWYQKSAERAETMRQTLLLEEAKKKTAAEELEVKRRAEEKVSEDAFEAKKLAAEKALGKEIEAERQTQERAIAQELELKRLAQERTYAQELDTKKRSQEIAAAEKREAESRARDRALVDEQEKVRLARAKGLGDERLKISLDRERAAATRRARWPSHNFPPPNGGLLVYTIMSDGNPACASYDGGACLWGLTYDQIDFNRLKPLVCGEEHRARWGLTGYENLKHWCNLVKRISADRRYSRSR